MQNALRNAVIDSSCQPWDGGPLTEELSVAGAADCGKQLFRLQGNRKSGTRTAWIIIVRQRTSGNSIYDLLY